MDSDGVCCKSRLEIQQRRPIHLVIYPTLLLLSRSLESHSYNEDPPSDLLSFTFPFSPTLARVP